MPFWDLQQQLGIDVDRWLLRQTMPQPYSTAGACHAFEREWVDFGGLPGPALGTLYVLPDCTDPLIALCQAKRLRTILEQRDKMIKEGKYSPPDCHKGKEDARP
ncbi:NDUS5 protein, partial [Zapornia atra]|nr:NDUS5 protein [Zapornia atra]